MQRFIFALPFVLLALVIGGAANNDPDWPQWQGADRTGLSKETGLLPEWPSSGPPQLWSVRILGEGYGAVALKGDRIFVQGTQGKESVLFCLNRADGKLHWKAPIGPRLDQDR